MVLPSVPGFIPSIDAPIIALAIAFVTYMNPNGASRSCGSAAGSSSSCAISRSGFQSPSVMPSMPTTAMPAER